MDKPREKRLCMNLQCVAERAERVVAAKPIEHENHKIEPIKKSIKKKRDIKKKVVQKKRIKKKIIKERVIQKKVIVKKRIKKPKKASLTKLKKVKEVDTKVVEKLETVASPQKISEKVSVKKVKVAKKTLEDIYIDDNLKKIVSLLKENLYYPRRARKRGLEGDVVVRFKLSKDAVVSSIEIVSSQSDILSRGAIRTIESLSTLFPKPQENLTLSVPISYRLR
jgi:protein TonB